MEIQPAAPPPPGQTSNFINPPSRAPQAIAVISFLMALTIVCVFLRIYSRLIVTKMVGWDDVTSVLAFIPATITSAYCIVNLKDGGLGPHMWDIPATVFGPAYVKRNLYGQIGYPIVSFLVKASIFLLLIRIFPRSTNSYAWGFCILGMIMITIFNILTFVLACWYCIPRPSSPGQNPPFCFSRGITTSEASAGFNMGIDIYSFLIPLPIIVRLNMSLGRKIAVIAVFATGLLACFCSILNLYYRIAFKHSDDPSWQEVPTLITGNAEFDIGIIVGCLPCFPAIWSHIREKRVYTSLRGLLSRFSTSRTSLKNWSRRSEGHVELQDVEQGSGKRSTKNADSSANAFSNDNWLNAKQEGTPTTRDEHERR